MATLTATSPAYQAVKDKVDLAQPGDTVEVPAGSATWASQLLLTRGIFLKGAGRDLTFITRGGTAIRIEPTSTAIANEETIRVEGFTFDGASAGDASMFWVQGAGSTASKPFKNLAIGNNRFRNGGYRSTVLYCRGQNRGAIFGNIFDRCDLIIRPFGNNDSGEEWLNQHFPQSYGTIDNLYFENNLIQWSSSYNGYAAGWTEGGQGGRCVFRYNTWNLANSNATELWDVHGFQNFPGNGTWANGQTGNMVDEFYGNTVTGLTYNKVMGHRGGWVMAHNNIFTGSAPGGGMFHINQYYLGYPGGSGCTIHVPGASGVYVTEVSNSYAFNNTLNGVITGFTPGPVGNGCGISENANYWNYNPSFTGATGIGRGTTPPTMTATNGVGYWASGTPTPSVNPSVVQSGVFYKRVGGAWVQYYKPFLYPHPLVTSTPGGGGSSLPAPVVSLSTNSLAFPSTADDGTTPDKTVNVTNSGGGTLNWAAAISGSTAFSVVGASTGTAPSTITVRYRPTASGNHSGTLTVSGGGTATVQLTGTSYPIEPGLTFNANTGVITSPFTVGIDGSVFQPSDTTTVSSGGRVSFGVNIPTAGDYYIVGNVRALDTGSNSLYINFDAEPTDPGMIWDIAPLTTGYENRTVTWRGTGGATPEFSPKLWTLGAGLHELIIRGRESQTAIQSIMVGSNAPVIPANPAAPASPSPANAATSVAINTALTWTEATADTYFTVFFGTAASPPQVDSNVTMASYSPTSPLAYSTTYRWRIVANLNWSSNGQSGVVSTSGPTWSFTTVAAPATLPPTVVLTAPAEGSIYSSAPATINFAATAAAGTNPISKVEYYIDDVKVDEDTTSPYTGTEAGVAAGAHTLTAKALDNQGTPLTGTSAPVHITVLSTGTHVVPQIILVTP